jgi:hypothetical protein
MKTSPVPPRELLGLYDEILSRTRKGLKRCKAKQAQQQVYDQAPYIWIGIFKLVLGDGSVAYQKNVINSFYFDPMWSGATVPPIFNTVTFK